MGRGVRRIYPASGAVHALPAPEGKRLDGLVLLEDGSYLLSSWDLEAVVRFSPDGTNELRLVPLSPPPT